MNDKIKDFANKVYPVYTVMKWRWCGKKVTKKMIINQLTRFVDSVNSGEYDYISSGGLYAELYKEDGRTIGIVFGMNISEFLENYEI